MQDLLPFTPGSAVGVTQHNSQPLVNPLLLAPHVPPGYRYVESKLEF